MANIPNDQRLDGWKAIANFLRRDRTTAIRWANARGLPVHRVPGGRTGTVYAIPSELEAWLASGGPDDPNNGHAQLEPPPPPQRRRPSRRQWYLATAIVAAILIVSLLVWWLRVTPHPDAPVTIAAVAAPNASRDTVEFTRGLSADLARFANASPDVAVYERDPGSASRTQYSIRTEIERTNAKTVANARLIAVKSGQVIWSRQFEQSGPSLSLLRAQVAANIIGALRCSFGELEVERATVKPIDIGQLMAICQSFQEYDLATAQTRARQLAQTRPDLAQGWAMLALILSERRLAGEPVSQDRIAAYSRQAVAIAPNSVGTWLARAAASGDGATGPRALPIIDAALQSHPDQPMLLSNRSIILFNLGYVAESAADALSLVRADPSSFAGRDIAVRRLAAAGRVDEARRLQAENEHLWPGHPQVMANRLRIGSGNTATREADLKEIGELKQNAAHSPSSAYMLARLYERIGNRSPALTWLASAPITNTSQQWSLLFWPDAAGLRTEPAFFRKMAELDLVPHWLARRKWPDFCADPGLRYDCRTAARDFLASRNSTATARQ